MSDIGRVLEVSWVRPPVIDAFDVVDCDERDATAVELDSEPLQPIAAFACIIAYTDRNGDTTERLISCRTYSLVGTVGYIGAICHSARGYRQFRVDRIECVSDPQTGETLGDGTYFARFNADSQQDSTPTWNLNRGRKAHLIAGLNVLAFMARCDGVWHPLEEEIIEAFTCSLWLRKEWEGEPPMDEILTHARRIAPDGEAFFKSLRDYSRSRTSVAILKRAVGDLIAADGVICREEHRWTLAMLEYLDEPEVLEAYSAR